MKLNNNTKIIFFNKELGKFGWNDVYSLRCCGSLNYEQEVLLLEKGYFELDKSEGIQMFVLEKAIPVEYRKDLYKTRNDSAYYKVKSILEDK